MPRTVQQSVELSRYWQPWRAYLEEGGGSGP
jgi:hypothetical protein